jgi:hypothetical protein
MPSQEEQQVLTDNRKRGWFWDYNDVFGSSLSEHAIVVRFFLARCANKNQEAWPSLKTIARNCKISKPTAIKAVRELESQGWIRRTVRKNNDEFDNTVYYLEDPPEAPAGCEEVDSLPETEGGSKAGLPPGKKEDEGVVKPVDHLVKMVDYPGKASLPGVVKPVDPNNTHRTIPIEGQQQQPNSDHGSIVDLADGDKNDVVVDRSTQIIALPEPDEKQAAAQIKNRAEKKEISTRSESDAGELTGNPIRPVAVVVSDMAPGEVWASRRDLNCNGATLPEPEPTRDQLDEIIDLIKDTAGIKFTLDAARALIYAGKGDMERIFKALKGAGVEYRRRKGGKDRVHNEMGWFVNAVIKGFVPTVEDKYQDISIT